MTQDGTTDPTTVQSAVDNPIIDLDKATTALNEGSKHVAGFLTAYLGVLAFIAVSVASTTDKTLLVDGPLTLPFVGIGVPLTTFYIAIPAVVIALHFNLAMQLNLLRRQGGNFCQSILNTFGTEQPDPEGRSAAIDALFPFFVTRALVQSRLKCRPTLPFAFAYVMAIVVASVVILYALFVRALPLHSPALTTWHVIAIQIDSAMIILIASPTPLLKHIASVTLFFVLVLPAYWIDNPISSKFLLRIGIHKDLIIRYDIIGKELPTGTDLATLLAGDPKRLAAQPDLDIEGRDLRGADFTGSTFIKLRSGNLSYSKWDEVVGPHALNVASLVSCRFIGCDFTNINLSKANLRFTYFRLCNLSGISLKESDLEFADFSGEDLSGCDLSRAALDEAKLDGANLSLAELDGASLHAASIRRANLTYCHMERAFLAAADLSGAKDKQADLEEASVSIGPPRTIWNCPPDADLIQQARDGTSGSLPASFAFYFTPPSGYALTINAAYILAWDPKYRDTIEKMATLHIARPAVNSNTSVRTK